MKKLQLYPLLLVFIGFLSACAAPVQNPAAETAAPSPSAIAAPAAGPLTRDDIRKKYSDSKILKITDIDEDSVLVESQAEGSANRFDYYNLKTGASDNLPTMPAYVVLKRAVNANYFIFEATGKDSESSAVSFPYVIKCFRIGSNTQDDFYAEDEEEYFALDRSVQGGSKTGGVLSKLNVTFSGLEMMFLPDKEQETEFYADFVDIPPIKTDYDSKTNKLTLEIDTDQRSDELKTEILNRTDDHYYISSYEITRKGSKTDVEISLKDKVKSYSITKRVDGYPYISIQFSDSDSTSFDS